MTRSISYLVCILSIVTFSFPVQAKKTDLTKSYGIGLQGATPTFGGISFRYNGLAPVYLQTVGRFILNGQYSDHMLGAWRFVCDIRASKPVELGPTSFHSRRRLARKKRGGISARRLSKPRRWQQVSLLEASLCFHLGGFLLV